MRSCTCVHEQQTQTVAVSLSFTMCGPKETQRNILLRSGNNGVQRLCEAIASKHARRRSRSGKGYGGTIPSILLLLSCSKRVQQWPLHLMPLRPRMVRPPTMHMCEEVHERELLLLLLRQYIPPHSPLAAGAEGATKATSWIAWVPLIAVVIPVSSKIPNSTNCSNMCCSANESFHPHQFNWLRWLHVALRDGRSCTWKNSYCCSHQILRLRNPGRINLASNPSQNYICCIMHGNYLDGWMKYPRRR